MAKTYVKWDEARSFCERLTAAGRQSGVFASEQRIVLPTEARWEYACRAGTTAHFSFGDDESQLSMFGWFDKIARDIGEKYAHKVGQKLPNGWGLLDCHGNVWEWCQDTYYRNLIAGLDPVGTTSRSMRVLRGGAWDSCAEHCRSGNRFHGETWCEQNNVGFRVLCELSR